MSAKRQTNWTTIAVAVGSMYRYLIRIRGCSRTWHIVSLFPFQPTSLLGSSMSHWHHSSEHPLTSCNTHSRWYGRNGLREQIPWSQAGPWGNMEQRQVQQFSLPSDAEWFRNSSVVEKFCQIRNLQWTPHLRSVTLNFLMNIDDTSTKGKPPEKQYWVANSWYNSRILTSALQCQTYEAGSMRKSSGENFGRMILTCKLAFGVRGRYMLLGEKIGATISWLLILAETKWTIKHQNNLIWSNQAISSRLGLDKQWHTYMRNERL